MPKSVKELVTEHRNRQNEAAAALKMVDHRGNAIKTGNNLMTYIARLHSEHGVMWPYELYAEQKRQVFSRSRVAGERDGGQG